MLVFLSAVALATVGGPQSLAVLGLEPVENKLFLLSESHGDGLERPQLLYYRLRDPPPEQRPDRPVVVESWYRDLAADELDRRLDRLRRSLTPLTPAPTDGIEVTLAFGATKVCDAVPENPPCQQIAVTVRWAGQRGTTTLESWGDFEIAGAWTVPGTDRRLVVLRHRGITHESGYDAEVPVLLDPG